MEIFSNVSLDCIPIQNISLESELSPNSKSFGNKPEEFSLSSTSQGNDCPQNHVAKKQTRKWAAWTRQEEESFFAALRQVGKNFEKITCHVQSKNKDQVRHYYYRLVRRMNKLLGPELYLDAKNSKDTNAAMLRWWSLLEKYSCKASKLHLKPRRFKIFVETLENQLLRDRKKSIKRRVSTGENNLSFHNSPSPEQIRSVGHDNHAVKMLHVDNQNIQKVCSRKGSLFKRPVIIGTGRTNYKLETSAPKTSNLRHKTASAAAYKRWEKAAIAGVSLVADAADHLERVDTYKEVNYFGEKLGQDVHQLAGEVGRGSSYSSPPHNMLKENSNHNPVKLKLQLFPVDECTRRVLEMEKCNPYLELTLSTRKKISSVLDHLNHKWRDSGSSSQELVLFPFWAQGENLMGYQKWTKDSPLCAADVYFLIGSPPVFRLRYGWFSRDVIEPASCHSVSYTKIVEKNLSISVAMEQIAETVIPVDSSSKPQIDLILSPTSVPCIADDHVPLVSELNSSRNNDDGTRVASPQRNDNVGVVENMKSMELSAGEWADSLTNISIGDLLSESVPSTDVGCSGYPIPPVLGSILQMPFSCDSFDAAIAAHIYKHQNKNGKQLADVPAIWEAEDTCDGFGFQQDARLSNKVNTALTFADPVVSRLDTNGSSPAAHDKETEEPLETDKTTDQDDLFVNGSVPDHHQLGESNRDASGLSEMYWPESLGPLDLDMPSCRYSADLILSDSLTGFNRLLANSLDAFQVAADPSCQSCLLPDFKIGSQV